jgi:pimeloyl-ACP methyl ester carboxylesterase
MRTALIALVLALTATAARADYAKVNGLNMYYETHGKGGTPVVLIHGAFCTIEECFKTLLPELAKTRRVIAVELQAHGHTADIDRPLSAKQMADDVAALMKQLKIGNADVFGYSMGGSVAFELARRHEKLVRKLVLLGTALDPEGTHPGLLDGVRKLDAEQFKATPWYAAYKKVAPKPEQWSSLVSKISKLDMSGWKPAELKAIKQPVLFMIGDSDIVTNEHAAKVFRLFGGGVCGDCGGGVPKSQLAIIPGHTHITAVHLPQLAALVTPFFDGK